MDKDECCQNCAYCIPMPLEEFMRDNENSTGYGASVELDDYCEKFKEKGWRIKYGKVQHRC